MFPDFDLSGWLNWLGHSTALALIAGALANFFPPFAAFVAVIYYLLQIYRNEDVQSWLSNRRLRKIAKYEQEIKILRRKITGMKDIED